MLTVDLPGTPGDAVGVAVAGRTLTLSATTPRLTWERSVRLGAALDPDQVSASYVDGRLTVTVGAVAAAEPRTIEISTTPAPAIEVEVAADEAERGASPTISRRTAPATTPDRPTRQLGRHRHEVPRRGHQPRLPHDARSTILREGGEPGVDRVRDEVEVDADASTRRARRLPSSRRRSATHGTRSLTLGRGTGGCDGVDA